MEIKNQPLATELLKELKANSRRWFIISIVELIIIISITAGFIIYLNATEEYTETTTYTQEADTEGENSPIKQIIGE